MAKQSNTKKYYEGVIEEYLDSRQELHFGVAKPTQY
jgi:hypothetical protein